MIRDRRELEQALGYSFRDTGLLDEALTHRSARGNNYERLEFLGDAILGAVIAARLFDEAPKATEGELSRLRATLVRKEALASVAIRLELGNYLSLGSGELKSGGYRRESILADALEAVLGAVYCDGGMDEARLVIRRLLDEDLREAIDTGAHKDPKTRLQERLQKVGYDLPDYRVVDIAGAAHERVFRVSCAVAERDLEVDGEGRSRRTAEQRAARAMLEQLDHDNA